MRYDNLDPARLEVPTFLVASASTAGGRIEVWLTEPTADGTPAVSVEVPYTGGRYLWNCVTALRSVPESAQTVYLSLRGPVRLDWFQL